MFIQTTVFGRLGDAAIAKPHGDKGHVLFIFSVAADIYVDGQQSTEWEQVKYFCPTPAYADNLKRRLVKGAVVFCVGEPRTDRYADGEGNQMKTRRLYADSVKVGYSPADVPRDVADTPSRSPAPPPASAGTPDFMNLAK